MALIHRISRLFKADFHAVLDRIEEPDVLLRQAIREMEDDLADREQSIAHRAHDQQTLAARRGELENRIVEIDSQLDLCFESKKDDLAKSLIRRQLETQRVLKLLDAKHAANDECLDGQRETLAENRATLESLRQKAELVAQRAPAPAGGDSAFDDLGRMTREMTIGDDEVEIAFLHEQSRRQSS